MTDSKKRRMSMLDSLAASAPTAPSMMSTNRALRSARDAVDGHKVWELDPAEIDDSRFSDRLDPGDIADLQASIEANGQTVPVLVRRHPTVPDRYLLVYGRRRLEAIRASDRVGKVRALIATLDDDAAIRAQVSENTARRDLSYIERALFARELLTSGFGNQSQVADVLNTTKSAISMALSVANTVGPDLARAIGPAHGIGRPRWEALAQDLPQSQVARPALIAAAQEARAKAQSLTDDDSTDPSAEAFLTVLRLIRKQAPRETARPARPKAKPLTLQGKPAGRVQRTAQGLRLDLQTEEHDFADWITAEAEAILQDLHARWQSQT